MTSREYLSQIRRLNVQIEILFNEIQGLDATGVGGIDYAKDRVQTSSTGEAAFEKTVDRIVEIEDRIMELLDKLREAKDRIVRQIIALEDERYMEVLYKHYVELKSIGRIAHEMHYSYNHIVKLHREALESFNMMWNDVLTTW